jgi:thioredoxin 1
MKQRAARNGTTTHKHLFEVVSGAEFESEVLRSRGPAIVMFWAPWSRPCRVMDSVLVEVARASTRGARVVKVNADDNPDLSLWYGVQSIPTLLLFINGKLAQRIVGTVSKRVILELLRGGRDMAKGVRPCEKGHDV